MNLVVGYLQDMKKELFLQSELKTNIITKNIDR
jgi:hypothetical protein